MRDLTYVKLIFFGKKPETELADAKYDGKINPLDFIQIKLIIVGKEKELTVVDSADRIVTMKKPIERVVVLNPETIEVMRSIKAADKIVGVSGSTAKDKVFFPEFYGFPSVGGWPPDIEQILKLEPDVVFYYTISKHLPDMQDKLGDIPLVGMDCYKPKRYVEDIRKLGYIFERKEEANEFIDFYNGYMDKINEKVKQLSEDEKPKVFFEYKYDETPYRTVGPGSGYHQKIVIAGGNNIFDDLSSSSAVVDPEAVITRNPEIIVLRPKVPGGYGYGYDLDVENTAELEAFREEIMSRPELAKVEAVENEKVYIATMTVLGGARYFVGVGYLVKIFHPDLFEDLDPRAIHQEYLTRFQGLDYDLEKKGVFVYPEPS